MIIEKRPQGQTKLTGAIPGFLRRVFAARGVHEDEELDLGLPDLLKPDELPDIAKAAERLADAVEQQESILIVGDYDADGATASALCMSVLTRLGATAVDFLVPNRFEFGYGLTPEIVEIALTRDPRIIVTVDNGVSSIRGVEVAQAAGVDVIVTDHHLPGDALPAAYALVNPNLPGCTFASKALAGVGVAYYVMASLRAVLKNRGYFERTGITEPNLAEWLDLVALGTVADVVPLDRNNRILVFQGLRRMRAGRIRPGIRALIEAAARPQAGLTAQDLGFAIGPRLNAAGRLDDMSEGIRCLLADDHREARSRAIALDELNRARREIEQDMNDEAQVLVHENMAPDDVASICVYEPSWHQGVIGIVAGRVREKFHRPVIAFADAGDSSPDELRGSARSIPGLHIRDALDDVAARFPGLLEKFGGHAMAAGLSLKRIHLERFRNAFETAVRARVSERDLAGVILTDGELVDDEISLANAQLVSTYGPWGQAFEEPTFHGVFDVVSQRVVGEKHLKVVLKTGSRVVDGIAFNQPPLRAERVQIVYQLSVNDYRAYDTLQLRIDRIEPAAT